MVVDRRDVGQAHEVRAVRVDGIDLALPSRDEVKAIFLHCAQARRDVNHDQLPQSGGMFCRDGPPINHGALTNGSYVAPMAQRRNGMTTPGGSVRAVGAANGVWQ